MVGNFEDASTALYDFVIGDYSHILSREGSTRIVYLINGVVYKIDRGGYNANVSEYERIHNLSSVLPANVFYPEVSLYRVSDIDVLAMEYIKGQAIYQCSDGDWIGDVCDAACMTEEELELFAYDGVLNDPSGMNVIRTDNGYYIIDAA